MSDDKRTRKSAPRTEKCNLCSDFYTKSGFKNHYTACSKKKGVAQASGSGVGSGLITETSAADPPQIYNPLGIQAQTSVEQVDPPQPPHLYDPLGVIRRSQRPVAVTTPPDLGTDGGLSEPLIQLAFDQEQPEGLSVESLHATLESGKSEAHVAEQQLGRRPGIDDIKVKPHPASAGAKRTRYYAYEDYTSDLPEPKRTRPPPPGGIELSTPPTPIDNEPGPEVSDPYYSKYDGAPPWIPFNTRLDFEFALFMQEAHLKSPQVDRLVGMVRKILAAPGEFSLKDGKQVRDTWTAATRRYGKGVHCPQ